VRHESSSSSGLVIDAIATPWRGLNRSWCCVAFSFSGRFRDSGIHDLVTTLEAMLKKGLEKIPHLLSIINIGSLRHAAQHGLDLFLHLKSATVGMILEESTNFVVFNHLLVLYAVSANNK
jgi:hypothetical protein